MDVSQINVFSRHFTYMFVYLIGVKHKWHCNCKCVNPASSLSAVVVIIKEMLWYLHKHSGGRITGYGSGPGFRYPAPGNDVT